MGSQPGTDAHAHPHGSLENPEVAHEHSDINVRGIVWFLAMLVVTAVVVEIAMWGMFVALDKYEASNDPFVTPLAAPPGQPFPEPRLQTTPWTDLQQFRADELKRIHSYGWVDQRAGVAHLPIEKAKELLLQRGLPSRANAAGGDADEGTHEAAMGESAGGRNIKVPGPGPQAPGAAPK
jgi:ABC-type transport system substrate-binding protein